SSLAFLEAHDRQPPGPVVIDLAMPGLDGLGLQQALREAGATRSIVFLSGQADVPTSVQAMKDGAVDFLTKPVDGPRLRAAVARAEELDRRRRRDAQDRAEVSRRFDTLTPRERQVLAHVVSGRTNRAIAGELGTVEKTIKVHRGRVMEKMRAGSLAELVRLA